MESEVSHDRAKPLRINVRGGASVAGRLLVEFPCPVRWQGFQRQTFCCRSGDHFKPDAPVGGQRILRKLALFGGRGDLPQKRIPA